MSNKTKQKAHYLHLYIFSYSEEDLSESEVRTQHAGLTLAPTNGRSRFPNHKMIWWSWTRESTESHIYLALNFVRYLILQFEMLLNHLLGTVISASQLRIRKEDSGILQGHNWKRMFMTAGEFLWVL